MSPRPPTGQNPCHKQTSPILAAMWAMLGSRAHCKSLLTYMKLLISLMQFRLNLLCTHKTQYKKKSEWGEQTRKTSRNWKGKVHNNKLAADAQPPNANPRRENHGATTPLMVPKSPSLSLHPSPHPLTSLPLHIVSLLLPEHDNLCAFCMQAAK